MTVDDVVSTKTDPILLEIIRSYLIATCQEMGIAMMRTSYSPIFNEALDFSCVIFDGRGELVAMGDFCPAQLGAIGHVVEWCIKEVGPERMEPGDVILHNDPYRGGCHLPEFMVLKPCFVDGTIVAYTANIAHMVDIGGMVPAAFGTTRTIFQEGLRLPPVRIYRRDEEVEDLFRVLISNVRTPHHSYGDLKAMIGSLYLAERRIKELLELYDVETFAQCCEDIKHVSEILVRQAIAEMPDGEWPFEGFIEDDGVTPDRRWAIRGRIVVDGDALIADYTDSSEQADGPPNQTFGVTASATYAAVYNMLGSDIPFNRGSYRPISIIAPPGSFVNVSYPVSCVGGNSDSSPTTVDTLLAAFARMTGRAAAADGGTHGILSLGGADPTTGDAFAHLYFDGMGWGGCWNHDGNDIQVGKTSNCANTPVEVLETRYPLVCEEYRLNDGAVGQPGAGQYRGGFGSRRTLRVAAPELTLSAHANRTEERPWGIAGGEPGGNTELLFQLAGQDDWQTARELWGTVSNGKFSNVILHEGDRILMAIAGGGGYGDPLLRDAELVLEDWREGFVSLEGARNTYGVAIDPRERTILALETAELRRSTVEGTHVP
jgi:N-methylhydantoinase B/oxoprolinase/acetone carboxylase alpha subunit